jgi:hypothetical protein
MLGGDELVHLLKPSQGPDAASTLFNLPGSRVLAAVPGEGCREVPVEAVAPEGACRDCGLVWARV